MIEIPPKESFPRKFRRRFQVRYYALMCTGERDFTAQDIAEAMGLNRTTIHQELARMERGGLVFHFESRKQHRQVVFHLTTEAQAVIAVAQLVEDFGQVAPSVKDDAYGRVASSLGENALSIIHWAVQFNREVQKIEPEKQEASVSDPSGSSRNAYAEVAALFGLSYPSGMLRMEAVHKKNIRESVDNLKHAIEGWAVFKREVAYRIDHNGSNKDFAKAELFARRSALEMLYRATGEVYTQVNTECTEIIQKDEENRQQQQREKGGE